jgi:3-oxoadipate enol-lactonase
MSRCTLVWGHDLASSTAHEDDVGLFDWSTLDGTARLVRYDARGHGESEATQFYERAFRWPAMVDDMLRAAGPSAPFVAGGVSMGCAVALWTALRAPRRIQALVLAVPPPAWEDRAPEAAAFEEAARLVEQHGLPAWAELVRGQPQPRILAEELPGAQEVGIRHLLAMEEKVVPAVLRGAAGSDLPSRDELRTIVVPTLILAWADDPLHPLATADALAEDLVLSEVEVAHDLAAVRAWPERVRRFLAGLCQWE